MQAVEGQRRDRLGQVGGADLAAGAVPLDQRVDHAEQQPAHRSGGEVGAQRALVDSGLDERGQPGVDPTAAGQRLQLDLAVAADPEQQGHRGWWATSTSTLCRTTDRRRSYAEAPGIGLGGRDRGLEAVERLVERLGQQVLLARHVVVDRGLREPSSAARSPMLVPSYPGG